MQKKRRKIKRNLLFLFYSILLFLLIPVLFMQMEKKLIPPLKEISHMQCKTLANQIIDKAVEDTLNSTTFSQTNLLQKTAENSYIADTILVNRFCAALSSQISDELSALPKEVIRIPLGAAANMTFLANAGPEIPFTLMPMGVVKADYETAFQSVGINQINYKIWINLSIDLKIVNPLYQESLLLQRKMMLVDLIFSGKVPSHYFQIEHPQEYLLTE